MQFEGVPRTAVNETPVTKNTMQRNAVKLTEAEKTAFSVAREALHVAEGELTQRIMEFQNTLDTVTDEGDQTFYKNEIGKAQVKLAETIISRERLWSIQFKL